MRAANRSPIDEAMFDRDAKGDYVLGTIFATFFGWQAATLKANQWRPIADAPQGRKLLLGYYNKLGKWRTITGCYYPPQMLQMADDNDDLDDDGYAPEGWYEESESHDNILRTDQPPTHWQPLPLPPTGAGVNHG